MTPRIVGLVAATHTPFAADGSLHLAVVERQAADLVENRVVAAFIGGTTGESHSLTVDERLRLAARWCDVCRGSPLQVIVHVGSNCLADARQLAEQAERLGAAAVAALAPSYFKPDSVEALVACCAHVAAAAPATPFYLYDIPAMTGVRLSMPDFLRQAGGRIPNLAGLKFTNVDLVAYQLCRDVDDGRFNILWGLDELLLPALACGAQGAVGSSYNFAAPLYHRLQDAFARGDVTTARREQLQSIRLIQTLAQRGFLASGKALMTLRGIPVGPPRLPNVGLSVEQTEELRHDLSRLADGLGAITPPG